MMGKGSHSDEGGRPTPPVNQLTYHTAKSDCQTTTTTMNKNMTIQTDTAGPTTHTASMDDHPIALHPIIIQTKGIWKWLTSPEKLPWAMSTVLSAVYFCAFVSRVSCDKSGEFAKMLCWKTLPDLTDGLHSGFCVWGSNLNSGVCESEFENSHRFSFYVDTVMAILAFTLGYATKPHATLFYTTGITFIIFMHGWLHNMISHGVNCDGTCKHCWQVCPDDPSPPSMSNLLLYILYNFALVVMDFRVANFRLPLRVQGGLVVVITAAWVALGVYLGADWALTSVFVQSHVMASLTGVFSNNSAMITPLVGWCFVAATSVGLTEFLACKPFLLQWYGHVWYDATLHLAMIATLIPRDLNGEETHGRVLNSI